VRLPKRELSESTIRPLRGAFYFGEIEWERNGGMNTADVWGLVALVRWLRRGPEPTKKIQPALFTIFRS